MYPVCNETERRAKTARGRMARNWIFFLCALLPAMPIIAEPTKSPADKTRAVELANLCLDMRGMNADEVVAAAGALHLEPENDPLALLEQHYERLYDLNAGHFGNSNSPDASRTARKVLHPMDDPDPMMAFVDADGWLFLVGLDATVSLNLHDFATASYTRYTAHLCRVFGTGWISDSEAREMLAHVLGTDFAGHKSTPSDIPPDFPKTVALGVLHSDQPSEVNVVIESMQGLGALAPVSKLEMSTARTEQPGKVILKQ